MNEPPNLSIESRFTRMLYTLWERDDRGALAALRRGLGKGPDEDTPEMFPYVVPIAGSLPPSVQENYYLVAALFAAYAAALPRSGAPAFDLSVPGFQRNFGASMSRLRRHGVEGGNDDAATRRFVILLSSDREELPDRLRAAVRLLRSQTPPIPIDWLQLLRDLNHWDDRPAPWDAARATVKRRWARGFWGSAPTQLLPDAAESAAI